MYIHVYDSQQECLHCTGQWMVVTREWSTTLSVRVSRCALACVRCQRIGVLHTLCIGSSIFCIILLNDDVFLFCKIHCNHNPNAIHHYNSVEI